MVAESPYSLINVQFKSDRDTNLVEGDLREQFLGLFVVNSRVNDDIFSLLPVDGSGNFVLITELQGVDDTLC